MFQIREHVVYKIFQTSFFQSDIKNDFKINLLSNFLIKSTPPKDLGMLIKSSLFLHLK